MRQVHAKSVKLVPRREMLDLVVIDGKARGIIVRNLTTGETRALRRRTRSSSRPAATARVYYLSTNAGELQRHGGVARAQARRAVREPLLHADSPDVHSGQRRPPVEADADEREPAQRRPRVGAEAEGRQASARTDSRERARLLPRTQATRASATSCRATSRPATPSRRATTAAASATAGWPSISTSPTR